MLWAKAFHIIALVAWFAGLFYLPRLFVYHIETTDQAGHERFSLMEQKLYYVIMTPAAVVTIALGLILLFYYDLWTVYAKAGWLHSKLTLVVLLVAFHIFCGKCLKDFHQKQNKRSARFFRIINEFPTLVLIPVVIFSVVKPF